MHLSCMHMQSHARMHACTHIYRHTHTHTHTHTHQEAADGCLSESHLGLARRVGDLLPYLVDK